MIEDEAFINRKRTNEHARDLFDTKIVNKNLLMEASTAFPREIQKEEYDYCYGMLEWSNHVKAIRAADMVDEVMATSPKPDNAHVTKHGVYFSPLLEGCIQFGKLGVINKNHAQEELELRNYSYEPTDGILMLDTKIKDSEYLGWQELEDNTNDEQKHLLKFYFTRYLTAQ